MSTLGWIIAASLAGGAASTAAAGLLVLNARPSWVPMLVSYAIGALLGAVFLEILPHAFEVAQSPHSMAATILFGILLFFVLEKLVLWRHCHVEECEPHGATERSHDHGRSGLMIMIGDTLHNFVDGVLIAAAFIADPRLGMVTSAAIIAHEVPQEAGDFLILLHSGYSKREAILLNLISSAAMLVGGLLGYAALHLAEHWVPTLLGIAAASMIYVAVADLIPGLHKRPEIHATIQQVSLIALGVASIWMAHLFFEGHA